MPIDRTIVIISEGNKMKLYQLLTMAIDILVTKIVHRSVEDPSIMITTKVIERDNIDNNNCVHHK